MQFRKVFGVLAGAALLVTGLTGATSAAADPVAYDSWTEDYAPLKTTEGLVFYQGTDINYGHKDGASLVSLDAVSGLAYTVGETVNYSPKVSEAYAPSYQLGIANATTGVTYARLVWEPYLQKPSLDPKADTYTNLEKGRWWAANVWVNGVKTTPFDPDANSHLPGSQSDPRTLNFFRDYFGEDTQVVFFGVKQGSTSTFVSTVSSLTFEGEKVSLGNPDALKSQLAAATAGLTKANADLATEKAASTSLKSQLDAAKAALTQSETAALARFVAAQNEAKAAEAKLVTISGTAKVGKTVTAKFTTSISGATSTYQWYVGGKAVKEATTQSLKLAKSQRAKTLSVTVTTTWKDDLGKAQSVKVSVEYLTSGRIAK